MAANKTENYAHNILNFFLRANIGAISSPATVYAALFTVAPTATSFGTEVSGTSYARVNCGETSGGPKFSAPSSGATANNADITFPTAGGSWGTVVAVAIMDHATTQDVANILYWGNLTASKTVDSGDTVKFVTSALQVTET